MPTDTKQMKEPSRIIQPLRDIVALVVQGKTAQTADLQQWIDDDENELAKVDVTGIITGTGFSGGTFTGSSLAVTGAVTSGSVDTGSITGTVISGTTVTGTSGLFQPTVDSGVALVVKGHSPTQSGDLQQWQDSTGAVLSHIDADGDWFLGHTDGKQIVVGATSLPSGTVGKLHIQHIASSPVIPNVTVRAAVSQTTNLQEWQANSGSVVATMDTAGRMRFASAGLQVNELLTVFTATHPSSFTGVWGADMSFKIPSTATISAGSFYAQAITAASVFTLTSYYGYYVATPTIGAGSTITTTHGMRVLSQGASGVTNAYGIWVAAQSGASTTNVGVRIDTSTSAALWVGADSNGATVASGIMFGNTGTAAIYRNGVAGLRIDSRLTVGGGPYEDQELISLFGATHPSTSTTVYGIDMGYTIPATATSLAYGLWHQVRTAAASFTVANATGVFISSPALGAGSVITTIRGMQVANMGVSGVTNAHGLFINTQSGAATENFPIVVGSSSIFTVGNAGNVSFGTTNDPNRMLAVLSAGVHPGTGTNVYGVLIQPTYPATATSVFNIWSQVRTATSTALTSAYGAFFNVPTLGASTTITNSYGVYISNPGASGVTNVYTLFAEGASGGSGSNYALVVASTSTGLVVNNSGQVTSASAINNAVLFNIYNTTTHPSTASTLWGVVVAPTIPATATSDAYIFYAGVRTAVASFTLSTGSAFYAAPPVVGAGSAITTAYGVQVRNQGISGVTNAYGVWIASQSGAATNNLPLVVGATSTWSVDSSGRMGVITAISASTLIQIGNAAVHPETGTTVSGMQIDYATPATATSSAFGYRARIRTVASAFTVTTAYNYFALAPVIGAGSTVSAAYGLFVSNLGASGVTNAYGVWISTQSGAANENFALVVNSTATFTVDGSGRMSVGAATSADRLIGVANGTAHPGSATVLYGVRVDYLAPATTTGTAYGTYSRIRTAASAFTLSTGVAIYADAPVVGAGSAITNAYGMRVLNQGASGVINAYGLWIDTQSGASTTNLPLVINSTSTWLVDSSGRMGVGSGISADRLINMNSTHPSTTTNAYGVYYAAPVPSTVTNTSHAFSGIVSTAAASFNVTTGYVYRADVPSLGAGSTIGTLYGVYVNNQGNAGVTNAYGVWIVGQSGAVTTNLPLVVGGPSTWVVNSSGQMSVAGSITANQLLSVGSNNAHANTGTSVHGVVSWWKIPSTATSNATFFWGQVQTQAAAFTVTDAYGYFLNVPSIGAGSAITTLRGMGITNQGVAGVTNAYGLWITAQSGAATLNVGARIDTSTTAALWLGGDAAGTSVTGGIAFGSSRDVTLYRGGGTSLVTNSTFTVNANILIGDTVVNRDVTYTTASVGRWKMRVDATAEAGSNAGSDFSILALSDAGAVLFTPIKITRSTGLITIGEASHLAFGTVTGTMIGTTTTQKLAFWNATPIVQPTTAITASLFAANTSGIVNDSATFDGYTIGQVVKALRNEGLLA